MMRWVGRGALLLLGLGLGLALAEGLLRLGYDTLPSLVALKDSPYTVQRFLVSGRQAMDPSLDCQGVGVVGREDRNALVGVSAASSSSAPRRLWVVGDSVSWGMGVSPEESYAHRLAVRLAEAQAGGSGGGGGSVVLRNLSMPGAGFCLVLRRLNAALDAEAPDVVVLGLFADDLESRAMISFEGEAIGIPDQITSRRLRWLARSSYLANLAWFAIAPRATGPRRFIDAAGLDSFSRHMREVQRRVEAAGGSLLVALLPPAGMHRCSPDAHIRSRCGWMIDDLHLLARLLDDARLDYIDLRTLWPEGADFTLPEEATTDLPIHPNAEGHALIAEAIWEHMRLLPPPPPSPSL